MKNIIVVAVILFTLSACSPAKRTVSVFQDYKLSENSEMQNYGMFESKGAIFLEKLILRAIINDPSPIPAE